MDDIKQHLVESDLIELGRDKAKAILPFVSPEQTLVLMDPIDADTFGRGFVEQLGIDDTYWMVLWQHVLSIPNAGESALSLHTYRSKDTVKPSHACILHSFDDSHARLRGKVFKALDYGIDLDQCYIISPWLTESALNEIETDFGFSFPREGITLVGTDRLAQIHSHYAELIEQKAELHIPRLVWTRIENPIEVVEEICTSLNDGSGCRRST